MFKIARAGRRLVPIGRLRRARVSPTALTHACTSAPPNPTGGADPVARFGFADRQSNLRSGPTRFHGMRCAYRLRSPVRRGRFLECDKLEARPSRASAGRVGGREVRLGRYKRACPDTLSVQDVVPLTRRIVKNNRRDNFVEPDAGASRRLIFAP